MKTNRRNFFQTMGAGAAGFGLATTLPLTSCAVPAESATAEDDEQILLLATILPLPIPLTEK